MPMDAGYIIGEFVIGSDEPPTIDELRSLVPNFCSAHGIVHLEVPLHPAIRGEQPPVLFDPPRANPWHPS